MTIDHTRIETPMKGCNCRNCIEASANQGRRVRHQKMFAPKHVEPSAVFDATTLQTNACRLMPPWAGPARGCNCVGCAYKRTKGETDMSYPTFVLPSEEDMIQNGKGAQIGEWNDITGEDFREYIFPNGTIKVHRPKKVFIKRKPEGDSHRIIAEAVDGGPVSYYIPAGWLAIKWEGIDGTEDMRW